MTDADLDHTIEPPVACTLDRDAALGRLDDWHRLLELVATRERIPDGLRLRFGAGASADAVERLAVAEQECCSFFRFDVTATGPDRVVTLEVTAPSDAQPIVAELFGTPDQ